MVSTNVGVSMCLLQCHLATEQACVSARLLLLHCGSSAAIIRTAHAKCRKGIFPRMDGNEAAWQCTSKKRFRWSATQLARSGEMDQNTTCKRDAISRIACWVTKHRLKVFIAIADKVCELQFLSDGTFSIIASSIRTETDVVFQHSRNSEKSRRWTTTS